MAIRLTGAVAHLEGDWSMTSVAENLDSIITTLKKMETDGKNSFSINCGQIEEADTSGLQLLNVWVECAKLRGIEPKLINVTDGLLRAINQFGFSHLFADVYPELQC